MKDFSYIYNADPLYIDSIYKEYLRNPESVDSSWKEFFKGFDFAKKYSDNGYSEVQHATTVIIQKELAVLSLIQAYRSRGHLLSDTNPIRKRKDRKPFLKLEDFDLEITDPVIRFEAGNEIGLPNAGLDEILNKLNSIYSDKIGFEYLHIESREKRNWLQDKIET